MTKPLIIFATSLVNENEVWRNGLFQNVFLLYELFEELGYKAELYVNNPQELKAGSSMNRYKLFNLNSLSDPTVKIYAVIEVGLNCGVQVQSAFRAKGAKIIKLYLGNILNIDTEFSTYPGTMFPHHVQSKLDRIWTSPHYKVNMEYARVLNHLKIPTDIAPYVWSPRFIKNDMFAVEPLNTDNKRGFTIIEPTISFQKSAFIPLMIAEMYYRRHPDAVDRVTIISGDRLAANPYFNETIKGQLTLVKNGLVDFLPRMNLPDVVKKWPSNIVISHQITNELNYIALEHLYMRFPFVHNSTAFCEAGYYYASDDIVGGCQAIEKAVNHWSTITNYETATNKLLDRYSLGNSIIRKNWKQLLRAIASD